MATYRDLQDRINLDYLNRTDLGAETKRAILRAIKHYEKTRFWFNNTATALAVGTASVTVAIPADFLMLDFATVRDASRDSIVTIRSYDRIAYRNIDAAASGVPIEIAYWRDGLYFAPKPASATSITVHYTFSLPALSADSDTNAWTSAGEDLIVHHACADMLANVLRVTDRTQIDSHKAWEMESYKMLKEGGEGRTRYDADPSIVGIQHANKPKLPGSSMT